MNEESFEGGGVRAAAFKERKKEGLEKKRLFSQDKLI